MLELVIVAGEWGMDLGEYLRAAAIAPPAVSPEMTERLKKLAEAVSSETSSYSKPPQTDPDAAQAMLAKAHRLYDSVRQFAAGLALESEVFMQWAMRELEAPRKPNADLLIAAAKDAADSVAGEIDSPADAASRLNNRYQRLVREWKSFLQNMFPTLDRKAVDEALDKGSFVEAVIKAKALIPSGIGISLDGNAAAPSAGALTAPPAASAVMFMAQSPAGDGAILTPQQALADFRRKQQVYEKVSMQTLLVQSAIFFLLFILGTYFLYADTWVGTYREMMALFILAFGVDLTSESVLAALKKS